MERKFDEAAFLWKTLPRENNEAAIQTQWCNLLQYGFELYDDGTERFIDDFTSFFNERYDPARKASHYFNFVMSRRKHDTDAALSREISLDEETGEGVNPAQRETDRLALTENASPVEGELTFDATLAQIIANILTMQELLQGKANNAAKQTYYRMFFTDGIVAAVHKENEPERYAQRENELFDALHLGFLDYFMSARCRTVDAIADTDVKRYGEMIPGREMKHPGHPLPNDVYRAYLREREGYDVRSDGAVSNQRDAYRRYLKESLC